LAEGSYWLGSYWAEAQLDLRALILLKGFYWAKGPAQHTLCCILGLRFIALLDIDQTKIFFVEHVRKSVSR